MSDASSSKSRSGRPRSQKSREAILDAVRQQLLADGYARLTMEGVAARAGVSKATIYRWWATKGELALEAAQDEIAIGVVPCSGDPLQDLDCAIDQLIDTFSRPLAAIVIFAAITTGGNDPKMARIFRDSIVYPWRASAADALTRLATRGEWRDGDIPFLLDVIVGTVFQRTLVQRLPDAAGLKEQLLDLVLSRAEMGNSGG